MRHLLAIAFGVTSLSIAATAAAAQDCPPAPDISDEMDELISAAHAAPNEAAARPVAESMWELWADAPDERAQELLDSGMRKRAAFDWEGAIAEFDALVEYCPDYAEGYNQRAFVNFIIGDNKAALADLDLALERSPRHVAALAGKALTLLRLERNDEAQVALRKALKLNPWLAERRFLDEPMPIEREL